MTKILVTITILGCLTTQGWAGEAEMDRLSAMASGGPAAQAQGFTKGKAAPQVSVEAQTSKGRIGALTASTFDSEKVSPEAKVADQISKETPKETKTRSSAGEKIVKLVGAAGLAALAMFITHPLVMLGPLLLFPIMAWAILTDRI